MRHLRRCGCRTPGRFHPLPYRIHWAFVTVDGSLPPRPPPTAMSFPHALRSTALTPDDEHTLIAWLARCLNDDGVATDASRARATSLLRAVYGTTAPTWGELRATTDDDVRVALHELGDPLPVQRRRWIAGALAEHDPSFPVCDTCGEVARRRVGTEAQPTGAEDSACAFCRTGHVRVLRRRVARLAWTTGRLVGLDVAVDRDTFRGEQTPLDDAGLRAWLGTALDPRVEAVTEAAACDLSELLGFLRLVRNRIESIRDAWRALASWEDVVAEEDPHGDLAARVDAFARPYRERGSWPLPAPSTAPRRVQRRAPFDWRFDRRITSGTYAQTWLARSESPYPWAVLAHVGVDRAGADRLAHKHAVLVRVRDRLRAGGRPDLDWCPRPLPLLRWPNDVLPPAARAPQDADIDEEPSAVLLVDRGLGYPHTLAQVRAALGDTIDPRSTVWVLKRMLEALSVVHPVGVVHGNLRPEHVVVSSTQHEVRLVGWGGAKLFRSAAPERLGESTASDPFAAADVRAGREVHPIADAIAAARVVCWLASGDPSGAAFPPGFPSALAALFRRWANSSASHPADPNDWTRGPAGLDAVAHEALGPPSYAPLRLPPPR
jgi:hypothetical protein